MSWFRLGRRPPRAAAPAPAAPETRETPVAPESEAAAIRPPDPRRPPTPAQATRIRLALAEGIVTREALRDEIERAGGEDDPLGRALLALPYPTLGELAPSLLRTLVPKIDPARIAPDEEALALLPPEVARRHEALPLRVYGEILCVAMARPEDVAAVEEIRRVTGRRLKVIRAHGDIVRRFIAERYPLGAAAGSRTYRLRAVPIDEEEIETAIRAGGAAGRAVAEWESIWIHGDVLTAEGVEE